VEALAQQKPATLMAQLRSVWPQVEEALKIGHSLRVIHERLNMAGIAISYRRLRVYRGRIQRGKKVTGAAQPETVEHPKAQTFDPLANLREQEQKRVDWQYPLGPPDERKLI
jgi:hypothetical protein